MVHRIFNFVWAFDFCTHISYCELHVSLWRTHAVLTAFRLSDHELDHEFDSNSLHVYQQHDQLSI